MKRHTILGAMFLILGACSSGDSTDGVEATTTTAPPAATTTSTVPPQTLGWEAGACASIEGETATLVSCDSPDAEVEMIPPGDASIEPLSPDQVAELQERLSLLDLDPGPVDGIVGPRTLEAAASAATSVGLAPDASAREVLIAIVASPNSQDATDESPRTIRADSIVCGPLSYVANSDGPLCISDFG